MFQEGDTDRNLYFLDKGLIRLSFRKGNRDVYIATIGPGDAVGAETFFARSRERTFTATPLSSVKANELHASVLEKWKNQANSLPSVLYDFCFRNNPISKYFQEQWLDRRNRNRVRLRGTLAARALDSQGNPVSRPFKGVVQDFSSGGVAFNNTFKGDAAARSFLGGRIALMSRLQTKSAQDQLKKVGRVVAVEPRPFSEFTFHVRFDRPVPQDLVDTLGREVGSSQSPELKLEV
jgi:CRP-like cAMP-binding protein